MRLLIDMNLSTKWVGALAEAGFEAIHWSEAGAADSSDHDIMAFAAAAGDIVLTRDLDFSAILAANGMTGPSVVHLRETDRFRPGTVERVVQALRMFEADLNAGAIVSIAAGRARIRRLPIASGGAGESS